VAQYEATLKVDQAQIDQATLNITYCHVISPIAGKVGLRQIDLGNIVHASDTQALAVITQLQPIAVVFSIPQDDIPRVIQQPNGGDGLPALAFNRDMTGKPIARGTLTAADSQVDNTTGTLKLKATFPNEDGVLFPNQFVNIKLQVQTLKDVVLAPAVAVQPGLGEDSRFVYVVKSDNAVELRKVTTGPKEGEQQVITAGLQAGEVVVTDGVDKLTQGTKVSARQPGAKGGAGGKGKGAGNAATQGTMRGAKPQAGSGSTQP
jgi:membrane fusion protein, multidrug efflux system